MKTLKISSFIAIMAIMIGIIFTNYTYAQGSSGGSSSGGGSTSGGSSSTGGDSSGSSSTGGDSTGGDSSGSDSTGTDTGGDSSGSTNTGNDSTGGDNSGSENSSGQTGSKSGGGDQVQNAYGEVIKLKAQIGKDSVDYGNGLMKEYMMSNMSGSTIQIQEKLQTQLQAVAQLQLKTGLGQIEKDGLEYLKSRLNYRLQIINESAKLEGEMEQVQVQNVNRVATAFKEKYEIRLDSQGRVERFKKLLGAVEQYQEKISDGNYKIEVKLQAQNILQYLKMKLLSDIEEFENE